MLPGIDDGPSSLEEALAMARMAVGNGITHTVATPHIHPGRYENDIYSIAKALNRFKESLVEHQIPLNLMMAAEVRISPEILPMVSEGRIPFLGEYEGEQVILLEFPYSHILPGTDKMVDFLMKRNIRPMIVHPERNKDVLRRLDKLQPFIEAGCLVQVTAGAVAGGFGRPAQERVQQMLERGWVTILASDAHNIDHRPPILEEGRRAAALIVGEDAAWRLVKDTPWSIAGCLFDGVAQSP